jgi:hypothetical protein
VADTYAGRQLTEQHRRRQLALRSATVLDLLALWPAFRLDDIDGSWPPVETALATLIVARRRQSAGLAANYYRAFRTAEGVPGAPDPRPVSGLDRTLMVATLRLLGPIQAKKNIASRVPDVPGRTLTRLAGTVSRQVLDGGRQTLIASVRSDRRAAGWQRVTGPNACEFCAGIAAEGIHAKGGGYEAHDHCGCTAEPAFT